MSDVDAFFSEQYDRMNMPDENFENYVARMAVVTNRCAQVHSLYDTGHLMLLCV